MRKKPGGLATKKRERQTLLGDTGVACGDRGGCDLKCNGARPVSPVVVKRISCSRTPEAGARSLQSVQVEAFAGFVHCERGPSPYLDSADTA